jgi:hypothetical protein
MSNTPDDGIWAWLAAGEASYSCLVRIVDVDGSPSDESDTTFTLSAAQIPSIRVTSPNGGETWDVGGEKHVTWESVSTSGMVTVRLSRNSGGSWEVLQDSTDDDGVFEWLVTEPGSHSCMIQVKDVTGSAMDTSDSTFIVLSPSSVSETPAGIPSHFILRQNYPNPFNPETRISFECPQAGHVALYIFDVAGRLVRTLANNPLQPGTHTIVWDGRDDAGRKVASGIYLCSMIADGFEMTRKMTLIR